MQVSIPNTCIIWDINWMCGACPPSQKSLYDELCAIGVFASSPILLVVAKLGVVASHPPGMLQAVRGADLTIFGPDRISQHHPVPCRASHTWSWAEHFDQTPWASALTGNMHSRMNENGCQNQRLAATIADCRDCVHASGPLRCKGWHRRQTSPGHQIRNVGKWTIRVSYMVLCSMLIFTGVTLLP